MATFEDRYRPNMEVCNFLILSFPLSFNYAFFFFLSFFLDGWQKEEAMKLVRDAIAAGVLNDLVRGLQSKKLGWTLGSVLYCHNIMN